MLSKNKCFCGGDRRSVIWMPCFPLLQVSFRWPPRPGSAPLPQRDSRTHSPRPCSVPRTPQTCPCPPRLPAPAPAPQVPSGWVGSKGHQAPLNANESRCPTPKPTFPTLFPRPPFPPRPVRRLEKLVRGHFWGSKIERGAQERARSPRARAASAARPHPGRRRRRPRREIRTGPPRASPAAATASRANRRPTATEVPE